MKHLLVTNDFPPKIGGIQSYLWELWRRLPAPETTVLTTAHEGDVAFDADQPYRVERIATPLLLPTPELAHRIDALADEVGAELVLLDPVWPVGFLGSQLHHPYGLVAHGAEVTVPARLPFVQLAVRRALRGARIVVAAGRYAADECRRAAGRPVPTVLVPPGVDVDRFAPVDATGRAAARAQLGVTGEPVVVCVSRLVPRKGIDVLIHAVARLVDTFEGLTLVVAGDGRDRARLEGLAASVGAPVRFLGPVPDEDLPRVYEAADCFAMLCRDRWLGLEQEGFGIVFLEAAATGLPAVAGRSGGSHEAVEHAVTGLVVDEPRDVGAVEEALATLLADPARRSRLGTAARARAEREFTSDRLARTLSGALDELDLGRREGGTDTLDEVGAGAVGTAGEGPPGAHLPPRGDR